MFNPVAAIVGCIILGICIIVAAILLSRSLNGASRRIAESISRIPRPANVMVPERTESVSPALPPEAESHSINESMLRLHEMRFDRPADVSTEPEFMIDENDNADNMMSGLGKLHD
jgi:hypothetical protein